MDGGDRQGVCVTGSSAVAVMWIAEISLISVYAWRRRAERLQRYLAVFLAAFALLHTISLALRPLLIGIARPTTPHYVGLGRVLLSFDYAIYILPTFAFAVLFWHAYVVSRRPWLPAVVGIVWYVLVVGTYGIAPLSVTFALINYALPAATLLELAAFALAWREWDLDLGMAHRIMIYLMATDTVRSLVRVTHSELGWKQASIIQATTFGIITVAYVRAPASEYDAAASLP